MKHIRQTFGDLSEPADKIAHEHSLGDWIAAAVVGMLVFALSALWPSPIVHPDVWTEVAVAAGTRPPEVIAGGVWRLLAGWLFGWLGHEPGMTALLWGGRFALGASVAVVYLLLRTMLPVYLDIPLRNFIRMRHVFRVLIGISALLFGCSEPVWRVFQQLGPEAMTVLLAFVAFWLLHVFLHRGRNWALAVAFATCGVLVAETPMGLPLTLLLVFLVLRARYRGVDPLFLLQNPFATEQLKWGMTFLFGLGLVGSLGLDVVFFLGHEGLEASGCELWMLAFRWMTQWWQGLTGMATPMGWTYGVLLSVVPFMLALSLLRGATDMEHFLSYRLAGLFLLIGLVGLLTLGGFPMCWFWTWSTAGEMLKSGVLGALFMFLGAGGAMGALAVAVVECWCRDYGHVAQRFSADPLQADTAKKSPRSSKAAAMVVRHGLLLALPGFVVVSAVLARHRVCERRMLGMVDEFVKETVLEMGPQGRWLFADGVFDPLIEFWSQAAGPGAKALSLMAQKNDYSEYLCRRASGDPEDGKVHGVGALGKLRFWANEKESRMKQAAVQLGFEIWRSREAQLPRPLGVLAHGGDVSEAEVERARTAARAMAERLLGFYAGEDADANGTVTLPCADRTLRHVFLGVQWRLARIAQQRAAEASRHENMALARTEQKLASRLDDANAAYVDLRRRMENMPTESGLVLTPREGLAVSLKRRDFKMARRFAETVLKGDPVDPYANYALGMSCMTEERWRDAVRFFERVLAKKADDPSILNNIAVCKWKEGKLTEALDWGNRALKVKPDAKDIQHNLKRIQHDLRQPR